MPPAADDLEDRLATLERQVRELRQRLSQLEQNAGPSHGENPIDQAVIRKKVRYDWQA